MATDPKTGKTKKVTTANRKPSSADSQKEVAKIFASLSGNEANSIKVKQPKKGLDEAVSDIYIQAYDHRNKLINFYVGYTIVFSIFVAALVIEQVRVRLVPGQQTWDIVPQWVLYLLVVGMFGQFIGLLTIVTRKVWTFEPFFKHVADSYKKKSK